MNWAGDGEKRSAWARRLSEWRTSGDTVSSFCRRQRVSLATFYYWKRRLSGSSRGTSTKVQAPKFLPVRLQPGTSAGPIEIQLPNGAVVRLPADVSLGTLREAIQAAGAPRGGPSC